ncbi:MAG: glycine C-acetyltransferase [Candidatus Sumerlaeia bacterium]|nr:glycine C-acetyltransferase [Candidatus Sumerlaeia bacterium]
MPTATELANAELDAMRAAGTLKHFMHLDSPQDRMVRTADGGELLVMSSNNYLGLANEPSVVEAGVAGLERYGAGTGSVRFICGTFSIHDELERELAAFLGFERALTYVSCWNANEGLIPTLAQREDAIISDALNHASIIDAVRLSKATREVYPHGDMAALEAALRRHQDKRARFVLTDGVFSMEGTVAKLPEIVDLCGRYDAILFVDDSHGIGVAGHGGRGVGEHFGVMDRIDLLTGTLGKALGGAAGGFVCASQAVVDLLEQKSRPQLFSNSLPLTVAASALQALRLVRDEPQRVARLRSLSAYARAKFREAGFPVEDSPTAIIPVILGETSKAIAASRRLLAHGIFVTGFGYPVVPEGTARLRIQVSAAHREEDFDRLVAALKAVL